MEINKENEMRKTGPGMHMYSWTTCKYKVHKIDKCISAQTPLNVLHRTNPL